MRGSIVIYPFPHTDLSVAKPRPSFIIKKLAGVDAISCLITTQGTSPHAITLTQNDIETGGLRNDCFVRPDRLFTADTEKFIKTVCTLKEKKVNEIIQAVIQLIS